MSKVADQARERRGKVDQSGRRERGDDRHVRIYDWMMNCEAWLSLSPAERWAYVEIERLYYPSSKDGAWQGNNGRLGVGVRWLAQKCGIAKDTAQRALRTLEEHGFIECVTPGGFSRKDPHASEWRLTMYKCEVTGAPASKAFMRWRPGGENLERGPKTGTARSQNKDSSAQQAA